MSLFKFNYEEDECVLEDKNCSGFINDEEKSVEGLSLDVILDLLNSAENVDFDVEYYQEACPMCLKGVKEKEKFFPFLEYHFYIYTKDNKFVISDISKDYEGLSFNKLSRKNKVDDSYIVSIIVCKNCLDYIVQIENCIV
ncbi:MAG: DUF3785 family protein [Romboutsia sp.]|uniref:DUF3785 family protein n=1 Tax=Romboutsia sp. TaxID=1965302 RepID=UPI003F311E56